MDILDGLFSGFQVAFSPINLLYVTIGVLVGTVVGLLPGLGPTTSVALLLPLTFELEPATSIIMLAGIYYGSMYGGRIPSILLNLPGDASSVVTTFDGYPLAKQGRAGSALGITAIGSFLGGTVAILGLTFFAPVLAEYASKFGSPEIFVLAAGGLLLIVFLGSGSKWRSLLIACCGMLVATIGMDPVQAVPRLTFGNLELSGGLGIVPVAVGLFGIGEILYNVDRGFGASLASSRISNVLPTMADWVASRWAILRASILGFFIGVIPGGGGTLSSVIAYGVEKKISRTPERFGKGAIEGLAATETADNASSNSSFIPLLTLGIPPNSVLALIFGALLIQNVVPGPQLVTQHPDVFWGVIASMYIGNILLLILNLPMIRIFVQILRIPGGILAPVILVVALLGVYSVRNSLFDVGVAIVFGIAGYFLKTWKFDLAPFILAFILAPILEFEFRRSMLIAGGNLGVFVERPISLGILAVFAVIAVATILLGSGARKAARTRNRPSSTPGARTEGGDE